MRVIEKTIYEFSELSDGAKEKARDWYRCAGNGDNYFSESVIEDAADIAELFGLDIRQKRLKTMDNSVRYGESVSFSGFSSQGDGASFEGFYKYKKGALKAIKSHAPDDLELHRIVKALQYAQKIVFYSATCTVKTSGRYAHSGSMNFDFEMRDTTGQSTFCEIEDDITQALRDFADWIYKQLETQFDYFNSDECVDENIECNDYEFDEDGGRA